MVVSLVRNRPNLVVLFGLGLGYHVKALKQELEDVEILVYEPCEKIYQAAMSYDHVGWQDDTRIYVYRDIEALEDAFIKRCIYNIKEAFPYLWIHPTYRQLAPVQVARLEASFQNLRVRQVSNTKTLREKTKLWLKNIEANWQWLLTLPSVSQLRQVFEQVPCVIVASGPSLSRNHSVLNKIQERVLLFACGSVYPWLATKGVYPHIAAVLEGDDVGTRFTGISRDAGAWVALASSTHPNHFKRIEGRQLVFYSERWLARLLGQEPFVPHGGNVASAAFTMGLIMGCNPIILVGQDLALEGDVLHPGGVRNPGEDEVLRYRRFPMEGQERVVYGHSAMVSYLSWYEESARYLTRVRPDVLLINATEGGARIRGFEEMSLEEACERYCRGRVAIYDLLQEHLSEPAINRADVKRRLLQMQHDLMTMENSTLNSQVLRDSLAWEFHSWLSRGRMRIGIPRKAKEFVSCLIDKTDQCTNLS